MKIALTPILRLCLALTAAFLAAAANAQTSVNNSTSSANTTGTSVPGSDPSSPNTAPPLPPGTNPPDVSVTTVQTPLSDSWDLLKDYTYEQREELLNRLQMILGKYDGEIVALKAKRATLQSDTTDWDQAMKEVVDSRADLKYKVSVLSRANTPDTFDDAKGKVGGALDRTRAALQSVRNSRTS